MVKGDCCALRSVPVPDTECRIWGEESRDIPSGSSLICCSVVVVFIGFVNKAGKKSGSS